MDLSDPTIQDINRPPRRDLDIEAEELHLASRSSTGPTSQDRQPDQLDLPTRTLRTRTAHKSDTREGCFVQHARKPHGRVRNKKLPIKPIVSRRLVEEDNRQDDVESACDGLDVLRADDCVTDTLLDDLCAAEKHSKTFCRQYGFPCPPAKRMTTPCHRLSSAYENDPASRIRKWPRLSPLNLVQGRNWTPSSN